MSNNFYSDVEKFKYSTKQSPQTTHFSLSGGFLGKLYVPNKKRDIFLYAYTKDVRRGVFPLSLCENILQRTKLFFDFDFKLQSEWSHPKSLQAFYKTIYRYIFQTISKILVISKDSYIYQSTCCISTRKWSKSSKKMGLHFVFPYIILDNMYIMRKICKDVIRDLNQYENIPTCCLASQWDEIVDLAVYRSGLRMNHSFKISPDTRLIDRQSEYGLIHVFRYEKKNAAVSEIDCTKWNLYTQLRHTSIHAKNDEPISQVIDNEVVKRLKTNVWTKITLDSNLRNEFSKIGKLFHTSYQHLEIVHVQQNDDHPYRRIVVRDKRDGQYKGSKAHNYCPNINGYHNSASIYFIHYPRSSQWAVKCFCQCINKKDCFNYTSKKLTV